MRGTFISGFALGLVLGLLFAPILRSWLLWRQIDAARREAALADALLDRLDATDATPPGDDELGT